MLRNGIKFQTSFNNALAQHLRFSFVHIRAVCCSACKKDDVNRIENNLIEHDIRDSIVRFYSTDEISFNFDKTYYFVSFSGANERTSERANDCSFDNWIIWFKTSKENQAQFEWNHFYLTHWMRKYGKWKEN